MTNPHPPEASRGEALYAFLDEYQCNLTAKRHPNRGWDMRISHPWLNNPVLSSCSKPTIEECLAELSERLAKMPDGMKLGLQRKNEQREKKFSEEAKYDDRDEWVERIW